MAQAKTSEALQNVCLRCGCSGPRGKRSSHCSTSQHSGFVPWASAKGWQGLRGTGSRTCWWLSAPSARIYSRRLWARLGGAPSTGTGRVNLLDRYSVHEEALSVAIVEAAPAGNHGSRTKSGSALSEIKMLSERLTPTGACPKEKVPQAEGLLLADRQAWRSMDCSLHFLVPSPSPSPSSFSPG